MSEDLFVLGASEPRRERPPSLSRSEGRIVAFLVLLAIAAGSIALGVKRDPLLTWSIWGVVGLVWTGWAFAQGRGSVIGAVSMFASVGLIGAGLSLAAYGIGHCSGGGFSVTADGRRFGEFCSSRETVPVLIATGFVIALAGSASVRSVLRKPRLMGFFQAFIPIVAFVLLFDVGYLGFFAAPFNVPALVILARKSGSRPYRIICYVIAALTLARLGLLVAYELSH